jgi:hypothetical protein
VNHGAGWIVLEESRSEAVPKLLSILGARRSSHDVAAYMRQLYIDRTASIAERLYYKKQRKAAGPTVMRGPHHNPMHIGDDPFLVGIYAHRIWLSDSVLTLNYKILINPGSHLTERPVFADRQKSLCIDI